MSRPAVPQAEQVFQNPASGAAQLAQSGLSLVPARTWASRPHWEQRAHDRAHAAHQGWPVILETMQGVVRPQTEQVETSRGLQVPQIGPSGVRVRTRCRRPQRVQSSRLIGSLIRQYGHNGCPWVSRAAGSHTRPHWMQGTARARAKQLR
jgi:hypothetical protein